jgi:excisionase family DNA binding protein
MKAPPQHVAQFPEVSLSNVGEKIEGLEIERPFTCEEAAELLHVHPKTLKRMAGRGELPGHFRFGRWYFYPSELDSWMRGGIHSDHRPCR